MEFQLRIRRGMHASFSAGVKNRALSAYQPVAASDWFNQALTSN